MKKQDAVETIMRRFESDDSASVDTDREPSALTSLESGRPKERRTRSIGRRVLAASAVSFIAGGLFFAGCEAFSNAKYFSIHTDQKTKVIDHGTTTVGAINTDPTTFSFTVSELDGSSNGIGSQYSSSSTANLLGINIDNIAPQTKTLVTNEAVHATLGIKTNGAVFSYHHTEYNDPKKNAEDPGYLVVDFSHASFVTEISNTGTETVSSPGNGFSLPTDILNSIINDTELKKWDFANKLPQSKDSVDDILRAENRTEAKRSFNECIAQVPDKVPGFVERVEDNSRTIAAQILNNTEHPAIIIGSDGKPDKALDDLDFATIKKMEANTKVILPGGAVVGKDGSSTTLKVSADPSIAKELAAQQKYSQLDTSKEKTECDLTRAKLIDVPNASSAKQTPTPTPTGSQTAASTPAATTQEQKNG